MCKLKDLLYNFMFDISMNTGAALGRVPGGSVNPWISRTCAKDPMKFKIKTEPWMNVNPWIEIPNVNTETHHILKNHSKTFLMEHSENIFSESAQKLQ